MKALPAIAGAAKVAPAPGFEAERLMQRFAALDARNQAQLLATALGLIERQEDEQLSPHEREVKRAIWTVERTLELLQSRGHEDSLQTRLWRGVLSEEQRRLAAWGVDYYGRGGECGS